MTDPIPPNTSDAELARAIDSASLPALLPALVHLSGDASLLERHTPRPPGPRGDAGDGISGAGEIRESALQVLKALREGTLPPPPALSDDTLLRMMSWCAGEEVPAEYLPMVLDEAQFDGRDTRRLRWSREPAPEVLARRRVAIIGAGLGGLCAAIRLEQAGIPYTVFEKNSAVGGTWFENDYPDLRVDVPNHFYSYSFEPNPDWSDFFAKRDELDAYVEHCATKYRVRPRIELDTEVVAAHYAEAKAGWTLHLRRKDGCEERVEADIVISAVGMLSRPRMPDIPGLDAFEGPCFHSARWDHGCDLAGRQVAVIGTGASAMQIVPAIAPEVERLLVFQRSRHWALPSPNYHRTVSDGKKWLLRHLPFYQSWYRFLLFWGLSDRIYPAFCVDPDWPDPERSISQPNEVLRRAMTQHIRDELGGDEELFDKVLPDYPPLGKRILQDNGWYRTLTRANVDLVTDPIDRIEKDAVVTRDGVEHACDVIVLSTGYHANRFLWPMEIVGRNGQKLHDLWGDDPRAYLGITIPGFPNFFCLYGPNTNPVVGSVIFMLECQVDYILGCLRAMLEGGTDALECRQEIHDAYNERVDAEHEKMVWRHPRVHSYYNNSAGRVTTNVPWRLIDYWRMTRAPGLSDFSVRRGAARSSGETASSALPAR